MSFIKKNTFFNLVLVLSQLLLPVITFPYISRVLGPEKIGVINFIDSITQNIIIISALGIGIYGVREIARAKSDPKELKKIFSELFIIHLLSVGIFAIFFIIAIFSVPKFYEVKELCYISLAYILGQVFLIEWYYQGMEKFKYITIRTVIIRIFSLFFLFILVKSESDFLKYYFITVAIVLLNSIFNFYSVIRDNVLQLRDLDLRKHLKPLVFILSSNVAVSIYMYLNNSFLGFLSEAESVAYYSSGVKITRLSLGVVTALGIVIVPQLSSAFSSQDWAKIKDLLDKSFQYVITVGIPFSLFFVFESVQIVDLLAGDKFLPASITLSILGPTVFLIGLNNIFGLQILANFGWERFLLKSVLWGMFLNVGLNFLLIPKFDHNGAAISTLVTEIFVTYAMFYFIRKKYKLELNWKRGFEYAFYFIVSFISCKIILYLTTFSNLVLFILTGIFSFIIYSLILIFFVKNSLLKDLTYGFLIKNNHFGLKKYTEKS